jgi:hypothetical protein
MPGLYRPGTGRAPSVRTDNQLQIVGPDRRKQKFTIATCTKPPTQTTNLTEAAARAGDADLTANRVPNTLRFLVEGPQREVMGSGAADMLAASAPLDMGRAAHRASSSAIVLSSRSSSDARREMRCLHISRFPR